jgi:methylated-DNA-[protein]-cysteine S-methyltransferase
MGDTRRHFQQPLIRLPIATTDGSFSAVYSSAGLAGLHFPESGNHSECAGATELVSHWHALTAAAVDAILGGRNPGELPPLDLSGQSPFRKSVWAEMRKLRAGETVSYGELADRIGTPAGARAVGNACGANPIPLLIPCHRILACGGKLGGFSGGLDWKRKLLAREGIQTTEAASRIGAPEDAMLLNF